MENPIQSVFIIWLTGHSINIITNFLLKRTKAFNPAGRNQTEEESDALQRKIITMLIKR